MDIRKLQRAIVDGLEDVKAQNIAIFDTEHLSPLFERVIIASGTSNRQTKALASSVRESVKSRGMDVLRTEGEDNGEWIIVDCGAAVAHIMQPAIRDYYHLEEIWGGKTVRMKIGAKASGLVKASEPEADPAPEREAGRGASAKKAAAKKPAAKKAMLGRTGAPAAPAKTTNKRPAARKAAASASAARPAGKSAGRPASRPEKGSAKASSKKAAPSRRS